jgi:hypothetical protein
LRTPPKSQPQVPAPACPLAHAHSTPTPAEFTLHYYTSFAPAHSRDRRYNQLPNCHCPPLALTLILFLVIDPRQYQPPPPIRSPTSTQPHQRPTPCICSPRQSRNRLVRVCRLFDSRLESPHRRTIEPTLERFTRTALIPTSPTYRHANLIVGDLKSSRLPQQPRALR